MMGQIIFFSEISSEELNRIVKFTKIVGNFNMLITSVILILIIVFKLSFQNMKTNKTIRF